MSGFLILLVFPIIWPFIAKKIWGHEITWIELGINVGVITLLVSGVWFAGKYGQTVDTEIWNGSIVGKERIHDTYEQSYECNCSEQCSGSGKDRSCTTVCDTCYETHYTVDWNAIATYGLGKEKITLDSEDSTWSSVYDTPDPKIYLDCAAGQPASKSSRYTNYVQAVPDSLFNMATDTAVYMEQVPAYPRVFNIYRYNRVIDIGSGIHKLVLEDLNTRLNEALISLGSKKQVNILVIVTGNTDPSFRYAVENKWVGGKKNDATIFIGVSNGEIIWTDVMTFALNKGNELYHVMTRDTLKSVGTFDSEKIANIIVEKTAKHYDRATMEEFEYLADQIQPATWVIILAIFIAIFGSIGISYVMTRVDIGGGRRYNRNRY